MASEAQREDAILKYVNRVQMKLTHPETTSDKVFPLSTFLPFILRCTKGCFHATYLIQSIYMNKNLYLSDIMIMVFCDDSAQRYHLNSWLNLAYGYITGYQIPGKPTEAAHFTEHLEGM